MEKKITLPKGWIDMLFYGFVCIVIMVLISIRSIAIEDLIVSSLIIIPMGILAFYIKRWCITVYEDRITFRSMFKTKVYYFNEITIKTLPNTRIFDSSGREVLRVSDLLDEEHIIYKTYTKYCTENNIKPKKIKKEQGIGYGNYVKIFCICGFCFSALFLLFAVPDFVLLFYYNDPDINLVMLIMEFVVAGLCLLWGIICLLMYRNTKIRFEADKIIVKNLFGIEKEYFTEDCSVCEGKIITKIYCDDKVIKRMFHYVSDDLVDIFAKLKYRK